MDEPSDNRAEDPWSGARDAARDQVRAALARSERERDCPHCGRRGRTSGATCPHCGVLYTQAVRRPRPRWLAPALVAAVAALTAAIVLVVIPRVDTSKAHHTRQARAAAASAAARELRALRIEQRPRRLTFAPAASHGGRVALVHRLEAAITRDARARARRGLLDGPIERTTCHAYPSTLSRPLVPARAAIGRYDCLAVQLPVQNERGLPPAAIGYPFWARVRFPAGRLTWCEINPEPGERGQQVAGKSVPVPLACDVTR